APTGSLVFDTFKQYHVKNDTIKALGFELGIDKGNNNLFTVTNTIFNFNDYVCIIIDECHYAFEFSQHGYSIRNIIENFNKKIIFVTGTVNFEIMPEWQYTKLDPRKVF
ncbi:DEAD/DEAH box helicase family protein, partial [Lacticaseibacillus paracasei]